MIRISRSHPAPSILDTSSDNHRYRHEDVVNALLQMQHAKCCYCEMYIADSGLGKQVEHFRPQRHFQNLRYDWDNLLLACAECNHSKWDKFPESKDGEPLVLDPSDQNADPEDHVTFIVSTEQFSGLAIQSNGRLPIGLAVARDGSIRGETTIKVVKLHTSQHTKRRKEIVDKLRLTYSWLLTENRRISSGTGDPQKVDQLRDKLQEAMHDDRIYAGLARSFFRTHSLAKFGINPW